MARISEHIDAERDRAAGKPPAAAALPWHEAQPDDRKIAKLEDKARQVLAGEAHFTKDELERALARLMLGG